MINAGGRFLFILRIYGAYNALLIVSGKGFFMAHQAIYRKWRPMVFEDIVGQSHITKTLKNQIVSGKVGHAYLFCGTRGTGKTTCAKVLARAVNCLNNTSGSPCNECEICRGIIDGSILDVNEIDAASNRKIDDIREIISDVKYVASTAKYTIYIIDEVHMLTTEAFNALLKTLEEPPEHVIFILATTEPQKVPQTILSRCQRFDFRRIRNDDIILRMKEIAHGDGLKLTDGAYKMIARLGDGSMRDALSILERIVSACGTEITERDITDTLGISTRENVFGMIDAVVKNSPADILKIIDDILSEGKDLGVFADSVIKHLRDLMICKVSDKPDELIDLSSEDMVKLKAQSDRVSFEKITNMTSVLSSVKADARWVKSPRVIYELAFIRLARPETDSTPEALMDKLRSMEMQPMQSSHDEELSARIDAIEEKLKNGVTVNVTDKPQEEAPKKEKKKEVSARLYNPIPENMLNAANPIVAVAKKWDKFANVICSQAGHLKAVLINRPITIDADGLILLFRREEEFSKNLALQYKSDLKRLFRKVSGSDCELKIAFEDELEGHMIDYWSLPVPEGGAQNGAEPVENTDPLDTISEKFGDIVEMSDDAEFVGYSSDEDDFSQSEFGDGDSEEFLEQREIAPQGDEINFNLKKEV